MDLNNRFLNELSFYPNVPAVIELSSQPVMVWLRPCL